MKDKLAGGAVTVLYVEDDENDVYLMRRAFEQAAPEVQLKAVADGAEALDYLAGRNGYSERVEHPLPALVLLDLKLPAVSGFEVLKWMRQEPGFKDLPVVVFSSSSLGQDKQGSDELGANGYLEKPASVGQFREIVEQLKQRWLGGSGAAGGRAGEGRRALRMKKLVQNKATKAFLACDGSWTKDCRAAQVFPTTEAAREAALTHQLSGVELYYLFGEEASRYDFTISLSP